MEDNDNDPAANKKHPKSIICIIFYDFGERAAYTSVKSVLPLYLHLYLQYTKNATTAIYHLFTVFVYLSCLLGAITADNWLGKFKTVAFVTIIYMLGILLLIFSAMPPLQLPIELFTICGLILCAIGCGMVKPCISSFGGDQYKLPDQTAQMALYFSIYVFFMHLGSLVGSLIAPILRDDIKCFGKNHCFTLPFVLALAFLATSIAVFGGGFKQYVTIPLKQNVFWFVSKAIVNALHHKLKEFRVNPKEHWLDYAEPTYGPQVVADAKTLLRILVLYIPVPVFFALYDQRGSRWIFQAAMMNGHIGPIEIKPEHVLLVHPLLLLMLIPLCNVFLYPLLGKLGIRNPLQKIVTGGILTALSFLIAAIVEFQLEKTYLVPPSDHSCHLRIYNGIPKCRYTFITNLPNNKNFNIDPLSYFEDLLVDVSKNSTFTYSMFTNSAGCPKIEIKKLQLKRSSAISYFITLKNDKIIVNRFEEETSKPVKGKAELRVLVTGSPDKEITIRDDSNPSIIHYSGRADSYDAIKLTQTTSSVYIDKDKVWTWTFRTGDLVTLIVSKIDNTTFNVNAIRIAPPNSLSILWIIPQFFCLTLGDVMFTINGLQFSYANAPLTMKAILQGCWQLMSAIGNFIVVIATKVEAFKSQSYEYLFFFMLMFCAMMLFLYLGQRFMAKSREIELAE